ncbi:MAG: hypothetical protein AAGI23_07815 [Bacteroidota bacterium]
MYKLDRNVFNKGKVDQLSFKQADYWKGKSFKERLSAALFLIAQVYKFPSDEFPTLDKTKFSMRKRESNG